MSSRFRFARTVLNIQIPSLVIEVIEFTEGVSRIAHIIKLCEGIGKMRPMDDVESDKRTIRSEHIFKLRFLDVLVDV